MKIDQVDGDRLWSMDRVWISVAAELFPELSGKTCGFWKRVTRPPRFFLARSRIE